MARTKKGTKPAGYEYWSARSGPPMMEPGRRAKVLTHRAERRARKKMDAAPKERGH